LDERGVAEARGDKGASDTPTTAEGASSKQSGRKNPKKTHTEQDGGTAASARAQRQRGAATGGAAHPSGVGPAEGTSSRSHITTRG
jgi:hypothetical protein